MELRTCKRCGKLFNYMGARKICPVCYGKEEETFGKVKQCLDDNKNMTIDDLSAEMDVSVKLIQKWVTEERLCFSDPSKSGVLCEKCGKPIMVGKFCNECKEKMVKNIKGVMGDSETKANNIVKKSHENKMRYIDADRK